MDIQKPLNLDFEEAKDEVENEETEAKTEDEAAEIKFKKFTLSHLERLVEANNNLTTSNFITWMGGKVKKAKLLISYFEDHDTYIEPFMGSAAVFFAKNKVRINVLNDVNGELTNLYRTVQGKYFNDFVHMLWNCLRTPQQYEEFVDIYKDKKFKQLDPHIRAAIYFYLVKFTFNNDMTILKLGKNNQDLDEDAFARLFVARRKLMNVQIWNDTYVDVFKKVSKWKGRVLWFLDPPYVVADDGKYYEFVFDHYDHWMMKSACQYIDKKGQMFYITYDDVEELRDWYSEFTIHDIMYTYSGAAGAAVEKNELLITNQRKKQQYNLLDQL